MTGVLTDENRVRFAVMLCCDNIQVLNQKGILKKKKKFLFLQDLINIVQLNFLTIKIVEINTFLHHILI